MRSLLIAMLFFSVLPLGYAQKGESTGSYCVTNNTGACSSGCTIDVRFVYCDGTDCPQPGQCYVQNATLAPGETFCFDFSPCGTPMMTQVQLSIDGNTYVLDENNTTLSAPHCNDQDFDIEATFTATGVTIEEQRKDYCIQNDSEYCDYDVTFQYCDNPDCREYNPTPQCYSYTVTLAPGESICYPQPCCEPIGRRVIVRLAGVQDSAVVEEDTESFYWHEHCNEGSWVTRIEVYPNLVILGDDLIVGGG